MIVIVFGVEDVQCIGVFAGQLKANEVATVVEILSIDQIIIAHGMPSGRLHHADGTSRLCWHQILSNTCACGAATSKCVEIAVVLIGLIRQLTLGEIWHISIYRNMGLSVYSAIELSEKAGASALRLFSFAFCSG